MEEDGEIFEVDGDENVQSDFSMSSYDGDNGDSLDIKPPQAQMNSSKDKRDRREKRDRHHRHKVESSSGHRHKSDKHRSRSDHRGSGERHSREKRRRREERSESGSRRHRDRGAGGRSHGDTSEYLSSRSKSDKERTSRSGKKESKEHRHSRHHYGTVEVEGYYDNHDDHEAPPLLSDPNEIHHGAHLHHYTHHHSNYRSRQQSTAVPPLSVLQLSPRELAERDKRRERMLAAEKQKELSQREAETRRMRREEEKSRLDDERYYQNKQSSRGSGFLSANDRSTLLATELPTSSLLSPQGSPPLVLPDVSPPLIDDSSPARPRKRKKHRSRRKHEEEEDVHIISEEEVVEEEERVEEHDNEISDLVPEEKQESSHEKSSGSDSSSSSSDSDSDSSESDSDSAQGSKRIETASGANKSGTDSTPEREGRFDNSPVSEAIPSDRSHRSEEHLPSPRRSVTPVKEQLPSYYPAIMGCRSVDEFECLNRIAEGTYGVVYRAREKSTNTIVALKRLKMEKEKEGFPITSLREINTLLKGQHTNIVTVREIVVGCNMDKIYIVMDYVEHDLKSLMETMNKKKQSFTIGEIKTLMLQLLAAVNHLHENWILHRDLKTSNLLLSHTGILKVGDFGLAREYGSPLKQYTPIVVTLWYRAPELLLGTKYYSTAIDVWSVGCIFGEMLAMEPMFPGKSEIDELNRIFKELGTPNDTIWPGYTQLPVVRRTQFTDFPYNHLRERFKERLSDKGFHLINKFLTYDPVRRITCQEALQHDYFFKEPPAPLPPSMFPTWPAKSEHPNGICNVDEPNRPPKPPSGGQNFKDLGDDHFTGFHLGGRHESGPGFQLKF